MAKKTKQLTPEEILKAFCELTTGDQLFVINEAQKVVDEKAANAEKELSLIKNNGR